MALRSPALYMGNPAVQHTAQNDRLMLAGLHRPEPGSTAGNRPLTATSGVLAGPAGTMGEVTLLSNTQFTVNPGRWVIYSSASALGGSYEATNDAVETLGITAQNATQYRRSYFGVWVIDSFVAGAGDDLPHWGLVDGTLAASAAAAALPSAGSLPANFLALGEFLIPPVGQAVTWTPYDVRTGLRGGILPVTATDARSGVALGQYRDHPTYGLQRWDGAKWRIVGGGVKPIFMAELVSTTGAIPPAQWVQFGFDTVNVDTWATGSSASGYIVPVAGFYRVQAGLAYAANGNGIRIVQLGVKPAGGAQVYIRGTAVGVPAFASTPINTSVATSGLVQCGVGDTLTVWAYQTSNVTLGVGGERGGALTDQVSAWSVEMVSAT